MNKPRIVTLEEKKALRAYSQCHKKSAYPTEEKAARYAQVSADREQSEMFLYSCDICKKWHISSKFLPSSMLHGHPQAQTAIFPKKAK